MLRGAPVVVAAGLLGFGVVASWWRWGCSRWSCCEAREPSSLWRWWCHWPLQTGSGFAARKGNLDAETARFQRLELPPGTAPELKVHLNRTNGQESQRLELTEVQFE